MLEHAMTRREFIATGIAGAGTALSLLATNVPTALAAQPAPIAPLQQVKIVLSAPLNNQDTLKPMGQPDYVTAFLTAGRLFRLRDDYTIEPYFAQSINVSDDGLTATITLRDGLTFADGTPLTSEDAAYVIERQMTGIWKILISPVQSVTTPDPRTVVVNMNTPLLDLPLVLTHFSMSIHPKAQVLADPTYFQHPVASGPYTLTDWTPGTNQWLLQENPAYWGGPSMIKQLQMSSAIDITSRALQIAGNTVDYVYDLPPVAYNQLPPEVQVYSVPLYMVHQIVLNHGLPADHPLQNKDVRHAMSLAIDRDGMNRTAFFGLTTPCTGFLWSAAPEATPVLANGGKRDLDAAKALLGTTPFASGFSFTLTPWTRPGWVEGATVVQQNLAELGIKADVQPMADAAAQANLTSGNYEAEFAANGGDPLSQLKSQFVPGAAWANWIRYNNPEVVRLLEQATSASNLSERRAAAAQAQQLAYTDLPVIPLVERFSLVGNRISRKIMIEPTTVVGKTPGVTLVSDMAA